MSAREWAVLVMSCDKYADLWGPFLLQFRRHFPLDGVKVYFGSNERPCDAEGIVPLLSGKDEDWSSSFRRILSQVKERRIFVILEDLFLSSPVDRESLSSALDRLFTGAAHVKCWASPPPDDPTEDPRIGVYPRGAPYRATVCGFWDKERLLPLLIDGESPWDFEIAGSYRTSFSDGYFGLTRPLCSYRNMVEKGSWIPASLAWARREGLLLEESCRPLLQFFDGTASRLKMAYFDLLVKVPWRWRVWLMNKLRRALISY